MFPTPRPNVSFVGAAATADGGKVGIGTISPATAFDVNGTVTATAFSGPIAGLLTASYVLRRSHVWFQHDQWQLHLPRDIDREWHFHSFRQRRSDDVGPTVSGYGAGRVITTIQGSSVQGVLEPSTAQAEGEGVQLGDLVWAFPRFANR